MHFIIHGIHHDHPNDKMRLVMPPSVSIPLAAIFFLGFWLVLGNAAFPAFGGFMLGYLAYDYTHYYLHHFVPKSKPANGSARRTCATTSKTTATATASPPRSGTSSSARCRRSATTSGGAVGRALSRPPASRARRS